MSVSEAQLNANRENAHHATAPRTDEGKAKAALNAGRHFLSGQTIVMPGDNLELYAASSKQFREEWLPVGHTEDNLVQTLCDTQWRIHRAFAYEAAIYANGHHRLGNKIEIDRPEVHEALTAGLVQIDLSKELGRLSRHSSRLKREYRTTLQELQILQDRRKQRESTELKEAAEIAKFCAMNKEPFVQAGFGFDLHTHRIETYIHRNHYVAQAKIAAIQNFNQEKYLAA